MTALPAIPNQKSKFIAFNGNGEHILIAATVENLPRPEPMALRIHQFGTRFYSPLVVSCWGDGRLTLSGVKNGWQGYLIKTLAAGETWKSPETAITITVVSKSAEGAVIRIAGTPVLTYVEPPPYTNPPKGATQ